MSDMDEFRNLIRTLRGESGCPWDKKQTLKTLVKYVKDEAAEVAEAVESGDDAAVCEELGDVLLIVTMMAQVAEEEGRFGFDDCVRSISEKIVRRHPHIFKNKEDLTEQEIIANWHQIKESEKRGKAGG